MGLFLAGVVRPAFVHRGVLVVIGVLLVTGLWDSLLSQLRVWAGSVNLPL